MRNHVSPLRCVLGLAFILNANTITEAATCKTVVDPSSNFVTSFASLIGVDVTVLPLDAAFGEVDHELPWLSKCAASVDVTTFLTALSASSTVKSCLSTLEGFTIDLSTAEGWSSGCATLKSTVIPCIKSVMTEVIMDTFNSTGGCCDDMLVQIKALFGDSLEDMVDTHLEKGANVACAERTFTNLAGTATTERCGYSIINSFGFFQSDEDITSLLNLGQVPNDQMCNAFAGTSFTNTKSAPATIGFGTNGVDTMGICTQPLDEFFQYLASWPIFSKTLDAAGTSISMSDLFTSGKSIRGNLLLSYLTTDTNLPMMVIHSIDDVIAEFSGGMESESNSSLGGFTVVADGFLGVMESFNSYATALRLHVPNNAGCTYTAQAITEPYPSTTTNVVTATAVSTAVPMLKLSKLAFASAMAVASLIVVLL